MIEVKNLYKSFDGKQVLSDINAKFYKGKINQIIDDSFIFNLIDGIGENDKSAAWRYFITE